MVVLNSKLLGRGNGPPSKFSLMYLAIGVGEGDGVAGEGVTLIEALGEDSALTEDGETEGEEEGDLEGDLEGLGGGGLADTEGVDEDDGISLDGEGVPEGVRVGVLVGEGVVVGVAVTEGDGVLVLLGDETISMGSDDSIG